MYWTDAHLHWTQLSPEQSREALALYQASPNNHCLSNGTHPDDWDALNRIAQEQPFLTPAFGLHPWFIQKVSENWIHTLHSYLTQHPQALIGEIGLDRSSKASHFPQQQEAFQQQIELALHLQRGVSIHCVQAWGHTLAALQEFPHPILFHDFTAAVELIQQTPSHSFLSLSPSLMQRQPAQFEALLQNIPPSRLLLETDAPRQNQSQHQATHITTFTQHCARILQQDLTTLQQQLQQNLNQVIIPS